MTKKTAISIFLAIGLIACTKKNVEDLKAAQKQQLVQQVTCSSQGLFATEVKPLIDAHCVSCHAPNQSVDYIPLDTYDNIVLNASSVLSTINHDKGSTPMPEGESKLSDCDIQKVKLWIDAGTPNN